MNTYTDRKDNKVYGWLISVGLHLLLLLAFFFASMSIPEKDDDIQGIIVNFGQVESAANSENSSSSAAQQQQSEEAASSSESSEAFEKVIDEKITEQELDESIALSNKTKNKNDKAENNNKKNPFKRKNDNKTAESNAKNNAESSASNNSEKAEEKQELDKRGLFTRKNDNNSNNSSEGNNNDASNADQGQNSENSNQESSNYENNLDAELAKNGISHSLNGRFVVTPPKVNTGFQKIGRVVVNIKVNQAGKVIEAEQNLSKSTTTDPQLVNNALKSARTTIFNQDFNAAVRQTGTISFEYKVR